MRALPSSEWAIVLSVLTPRTPNTARICRWSCRFSPTPGKLVRHGDAMPCQQRRRTDTRELQQLRRADCAGRQHHRASCAQRLHAAVVAAALDAGRRQRAVTASLEQHALHHRAGAHLQVAPALHRPQEGLAGIPAHAALLVDLEVADAFVVAAVEVIGGRDAGLLRGERKGVEQFPRQALALDAPLAGVAMPGRRHRANAPRDCMKCGRQACQRQASSPSVAAQPS